LPTLATEREKRIRIWLSIAYLACVRSNPSFRRPASRCRTQKAASEIKHDGYRLIVQREGQRVRLWTRNGPWSDRYPLIVEAALPTATVRS
jgi:ATP-dependent DNA ligase